MRTDETSTLPVAAIAALHQGNKIEAIKIVRRERGMELKLAKDAVETYLRSQPALQASLAAKQAAVRGRALRWLVIVLAVIAYFLYAGR
ncbi:MAG: hypothetical protein ACLGHO_02655 [Gammaproteobacteria bacterium]